MALFEAALLPASPSQGRRVWHPRQQTGPWLAGALLFLALWVFTAGRSVAEPSPLAAALQLTSRALLSHWVTSWQAVAERPQLVFINSKSGRTLVLRRRATAMEAADEDRKKAARLSFSALLSMTTMSTPAGASALDHVPALLQAWNEEYGAEYGQWEMPTAPNGLSSSIPNPQRMAKRSFRPEDPITELLAQWNRMYGPKYGVWEMTLLRPVRLRTPSGPPAPSSGLGAVQQGTPVSQAPAAVGVQAALSTVQRWAVVAGSSLTALFLVYHRIGHGLLFLVFGNQQKASCLLPRGDSLREVDVEAGVPRMAAVVATADIDGAECFGQASDLDDGPVATAPASAALPQPPAPQCPSPTFSPATVPDTAPPMPFSEAGPPVTLSRLATLTACRNPSPFLTGEALQTEADAGMEEASAVPRDPIPAAPCAEPPPAGVAHPPLTAPAHSPAPANAPVALLAMSHTASTDCGGFRGALRSGGGRGGRWPAGCGGAGGTALVGVMAGAAGWRLARPPRSSGAGLEETSPNRHPSESSPLAVADGSAQQRTPLDPEAHAPGEAKGAAGPAGPPADRSGSPGPSHASVCLSDRPGVLEEGEGVHAEGSLKLSASLLSEAHDNMLPTLNSGIEGGALLPSLDTEALVEQPLQQPSVTEEGAVPACALSDRTVSPEPSRVSSASEEPNAPTPATDDCLEAAEEQPTPTSFEGVIAPDVPAVDLPDPTGSSLPPPTSTVCAVGDDGVSSAQLEGEGQQAAEALDWDNGTASAVATTLSEASAGVQTEAANESEASAVPDAVPEAPAPLRLASARRLNWTAQQPVRVASPTQRASWAVVSHRGWESLPASPLIAVEENSRFFDGLMPQQHGDLSPVPSRSMSRRLTWTAQRSVTTLPLRDRATSVVVVEPGGCAGRNTVHQ